MRKANEVMTQSLAICSPEDTVTYAASIMRDRDIGDVLVMEDGKLMGIVTDRDLAIQALTDSIDPHNTPIRRFMCTKVITGSPDWSMTRVVRTMSKYQIRRLPILQDDQLIGIISLADIARHANRNILVSKSIRAISKESSETRANGAGHVGAWIGLSMLALASTGVALLTWNRSGKELRNQVADSKIYHSAQQAMTVARDRMDEAVSSKPARDIRKRIQSNIKEISTQLPRIEYKPAKRKAALFR
jgi:CBS domain-containing protein/gas vesicle protein